MILIINTADAEKAEIALVKNNKVLKQKVFQAKYKQAEKLLGEIDKLLGATGLRPNNLKGIIVVSGPGPFTALRVGVVTANTLAWALKISVIGVKERESRELSELSKKLKKVKVGNIIEPFYGKEPNIILKK